MVLCSVDVGNGEVNSSDQDEMLIAERGPPSEVRYKVRGVECLKMWRKDTTGKEAAVI